MTSSVTPKLIVAIDPGSVNTGVVLFSYDSERRKANVMYKRIVAAEDLTDMLKLLSANKGMTVVLEMFRHAYSTGNFRNRKSTNVTADELATLNLCKRIKVMAASSGHKLITQEPSVLAMGRKWYPLPLPKGHIKDDDSACIHGMKYMMDYGLIDSARSVTFYAQDQLPLDDEGNDIRADEQGMM